jgi:hypothetical protein
VLDEISPTSDAHTLVEFIEPCPLVPGVHLIELVCCYIKTV